jgi:hypothetical protein
MALGRRNVGVIRAVIAVKGQLVDPAINEKESDLEAYWESYFDSKHLVFYPGQKPTWFTWTPLTRRQKDAVDAMTGGRSMTSWYIRCATTNVENYLIVGADGKELPPPKLEREKQGALGELVSEEWLDQMNFPTDLRIAYFAMIQHTSEAALPLSKPCAPPSGDGENETPTSTG